MIVWIRPDAIRAVAQRASIPTGECSPRMSHMAASAQTSATAVTVPGKKELTMGKYPQMVPRLTPPLFPIVFTLHARTRDIHRATYLIPCLPGMSTVLHRQAVPPVPSELRGD
jgi:hypothetical protein